jgi:F420-0:gamma-glutamyl ligase
MKCVAYKTILVKPGDNLLEVMTASLPEKLPERCVVAVTSKIVSICENNLVKIPDNPEEAKLMKKKLVHDEAEYYTRGSKNYEVELSIRNHRLTPKSGIDTSNGGGYFVLWPKDSQKTANDLWEKLRAHYGVKELGVIIVDSHTVMMRWGVVGTVLAHCGFQAVTVKIGDEDLFGREFQMTHVNVAEALSVAAVYQMGETNEQTPLAVISEDEKIVWQDHVPTQEELDAINIDIDDDLFANLFLHVPWTKGGRVGYNV